MNGKASGSNQDYDMSSDDDDMPLVSSVSSWACFGAHTSPSLVIQSQTTRVADATSAAPPRSLKRKKAAYAETSSEDDTPLASSPVKSSKANSRLKTKVEPSDSESDDAPTQRRATNGRASKPPKKKVKEESNSSDDEEDDKPLVATKRAAKVKPESDSEDEKPLKKPAASRARGKKAKVEDSPSESEATKPKVTRTSKKESTKKSKKKEKEEKEEEEVFRWWDANDPNGDGTTKWTTLEHNGVIFPPPYEPLPSDVKMKYDGRFPHSCGRSYKFLLTPYRRQVGQADR